MVFRRESDCDAQPLRSMAGLHCCAITGAHNATITIVTAEIRDTNTPQLRMTFAVRINLVESLYLRNSLAYIGTACDRQFGHQDRKSVV